MSYEKRRIFYSGFSDDVVQSADQSKSVPQGYQWIKKGLLFRLGELLLYPIAFVFGEAYCRLFLHVSFKNRSVLRKAGRKGYYLYANHTQPVGDVFIPALACAFRHIYVIVSPANLGIPLIGRLLPMLGALPVPSDAAGMTRLNEAVSARCRQGNAVVIYPEAHVWPYCPFIRPFPSTAFRYPVKDDAPSFCMTSTYSRRLFGRRPKQTVYIDGPFYPPEEGSVRQKRDRLHDEIYGCMLERSRSSSYAYIEYKEAEKQ